MQNIAYGKLLNKVGQKQKPYNKRNINWEFIRTISINKILIFAFNVDWGRWL